MPDARNYGNGLEPERREGAKAPTYRFTMLRLYARKDPNWVRPWGDAQPVTVLAETEQEARDKVFALSAEPERGRMWVVRTVRVDEGSDDE